jgi:14-3-3 protein
MLGFVEEMIALGSADVGLSQGERDVFVDACKSVTDNLRDSGRKLCALEIWETNNPASPTRHLIALYKGNITCRLDAFCRHVTQCLLTISTTPDVKVIYYKMLVRLCFPG